MTYAKRNKKGWTKELVENQDYLFKLFESCKIENSLDILQKTRLWKNKI